MAFDLTLNCPSSSPAESLRLPLSVADALLKSNAFTKWEKDRERKAKVVGLLMERIDNVTKAIGNLAKVFSSKR